MFDVSVGALHERIWRQSSQRARHEFAASPLLVHNNNNNQSL
jgi:uncharacterized membrane protein